VIIEEVEEYCKRILVCSKCGQMPFHNLQHTLEVVENVLEIGQAMGCSPEELEPVIIAAWFHDTGFCELYYGHELWSGLSAKKFLDCKNYSPSKSEIVVDCIEATKMPQSPKNTYSEILCDADVLHISSENFFYRKLLLRREWDLFLGKKYTDKEWHELNLAFLLKQNFFTSYGKEKLQEGHYANEEKVRTILSFY